VGSFLISRRVKIPSYFNLRGENNMDFFSPLEIVLMIAFTSMSLVGLFFAHLSDIYRVKVKYLENKLPR